MSKNLEWESPAIVLRATPYGETSLLVCLLTRDYGLWRAMVRGGASRRQIAQWQSGVICLARWRAKISGQLGFFAAETVHNPAARLLDHPLALAVLSSACALAVEALPEKERHEDVFSSLLHLLSLLMVAPDDEGILAVYFRWEMLLLSALGYGLDFSCCAVCGEKRDDLCYVSPRSGRAVSSVEAGKWKDRLLPLPSFLLSGDETGDIRQWEEAGRLLGYFLKNSAFAALHRPLPPARVYLVAHLARRCEHARESDIILEERDRS